MNGAGDMRDDVRIDRHGRTFFKGEAKVDNICVDGEGVSAAESGYGQWLI